MFGLSDNTSKSDDPAANGSDNHVPATMNTGTLDNSSLSQPSVPSSIPHDAGLAAVSAEVEEVTKNEEANQVNSANSLTSSYQANASAAKPSDLNMPIATPATNGSGADEDLIKIKTQALQSLAPLVDHLDQTNEEKFKTTMMLIQASDNADLIQEAYDAANKIEDEKVRAQALLDVVNEINYFTQQQKNA